MERYYDVVEDSCKIKTNQVQEYCSRYGKPEFENPGSGYVPQNYGSHRQAINESESDIP